MLGVEMTEIQRPEHDLVFSHLIEKTVERVAKFFGYSEAQE